MEKIDIFKKFLNELLEEKEQEKNNGFTKKEIVEMSQQLDRYIAKEQKRRLQKTMAGRKD